MFRSEGRKLIGRAAVLQAAAGIHVGQDHRLFGRQDFRRFGHEADTAKSDDVGIGRRGFARQVEAVADEIGQVLDFRLLVIMRKDDGVALRLQPPDFGKQVDTLQRVRLRGHRGSPRRCAASSSTSL
jgi:hypothetical protein